MANISRRMLCLAGLAKLALATVMLLLVAAAEFAGLWDRSYSIGVLALALAVGQGGHAMVLSHCVLPKGKS